jgi:hypothetical protein
MVMVGMVGLGKTAAHRRAVANGITFHRPWIDTVTEHPVPPGNADWGK